MDWIHQTGNSRAEHGKEAMVVPGAQETMAGGLRGRGLISRPGHFSRNPSTPTPQKKKNYSLGHQEPSGARHRNRTHSNKTVYRTRQTGQDNPQEQEALLGRARKLRSMLAMTWSQGPSQGCFRNRFYLYDRTLDKSPWTRHYMTGIKTAPVDTTRIKTALLAMTCGLRICNYRTSRNKADEE